MNYKVKPEYGAKVREENVVIGHYTDYAIVKACNGTLCYIKDQNENLGVGEYVQMEHLRPISSMSKDLYFLIMQEFQEVM